jgi:hypothetical protein
MLIATQEDKEDLLPAGLPESMVSLIEFGSSKYFPLHSIAS